MSVWGLYQHALRVLAAGDLPLLMPVPGKPGVIAVAVMDGRDALEIRAHRGRGVEVCVAAHLLLSERERLAGL